MELIDTLWNVNTAAVAARSLSVGINRYIMECKLIIMHLEDIAILELIDTLWNVNENVIVLVGFAMEN